MKLSKPSKKTKRFTKLNMLMVDLLSGTFIECGGSYTNCSGTYSTCNGNFLRC